MPEPADAPPPSADDARSLLEAIQTWAQHALPAPPSGHGGPECQWCPLCQLASVLRGEHPELTERVAEAGAALTFAFRALVDSATARGAPGPPGDASPDGGAVADGASDKPRPRPRVERITLDDETG